MSMAITFKSESLPLDSKRFEIRSTLGQGGFGVVYRAFDRDLGAQVALKTLHHTNARSVYRFKREFRALADIAHPNLATLFELIQEESLWYFTMELVDGVDFLSWIRGVRGQQSRLITPSIGASDFNATVEGSAESLRLQSQDRARTNGKMLEATIEGNSAELAAQSAHTQDLPAPSSASSGQQFNGQRLNGQSAVKDALFTPDLPCLYEALGQLTRGVRALHDYGKMHRDIKPSNVLVERDGRVVLLDFGMVADLGPADSPLQILERQSDPEKVTFAGTPRYMAPEQAMGEELDAASDWYSVGVMLYEALSGGIPPIDGKTSLQILLCKQSMAPTPICELAPETPAILGQLCMDLLSVDPTERPGADRILEVLNQLQNGGEHAQCDAAARAPVLGAETPTQGLERPGAPVSKGLSKSQRGDIFVGRKPQLQQLRRALRECNYSNRLAVVNIHGASGMGKSALARRFIRSFADPEDASRGSAQGEDLAPVVLQGRCYPNESMPYKALDSLMDELSTFLHQFNVEELGAWIGEDIGALTHLFPVLERAPSIRSLLDAHESESAGRREAPLDAPLLREQAFRALRNLVGGLARKHCLVLYIDDVQWGDEDSAMLLKELLGPPNPPPLFLMSTWRSEDVESSPFLAAFLPAIDTLGDKVRRLDMPIDELSDQESIELVERVFKGAAMVPVSAPPTPRSDASRSDAARSIAREARGNPFFIDELARYSLAHDSGPNSDLSTLGDMIFRRVSKLPVPAKRLLEVLAVAGQPMDRRVVRAVANLGEDEQSALALLRSEHLVRGKSTRDYEWLEPYHARVGETLNARLDERARISYHAKIAVELEQWGHFDPESVALHFLKAGDSEKGGHYSLLAAPRRRWPSTMPRSSTNKHSRRVIGRTNASRSSPSWADATGIWAAGNSLPKPL